MEEEVQELKDVQEPESRKKIQIMKKKPTANMEMNQEKSNMQNEELVEQEDLEYKPDFRTSYWKRVEKEA